MSARYPCTITIRPAVVLLVVLLVLAMGAGGAPERAAAGAAVPPGSRIPWQGGEWYLHGANVPWFNWGCDFGCGTGAGDKKGVSDPEANAQIDATVREARAAGVRVLRWWVFPGDAAHIRRDAAGAPAGLDPGVFVDFDAALKLAEANDVYYVFTLFSAPSHIPAGWLADPAQRGQLTATLGQIFFKYRDNPRILAWDVFNEPDWDIWNGKVNLDDARATVQAIADAVHATSGAYVTTAAAHLDGLSHWTGLGLDFYTANWYDYMSSGGWCALCADYAEVRARYGLDAPLVIGEFYGGPDTQPPGRFAAWYSKGYAGAWAWSLFWDHTGDKLRVDLAASGDFAGQLPDIGPRKPASP